MLVTEGGIAHALGEDTRQQRGYFARDLALDSRSRFFSSGVSVFSTGRNAQIFSLISTTSLTTFDVEGHTIAASGCLARTDDGALLAGAFDRQFNGSPLTTGLHVLVIQRTEDIIRVEQPVGSDTPLAITIPDEWRNSIVQAVAADGSVSEVAADLDDGKIRFGYMRSVDGRSVERYEIIPVF